MMHTLPNKMCQRFLSALLALVAAGVFLCPGVPALLLAQSAPSAAPLSSPAPAKPIPAWQRDLSAVQVLQTAAALSVSQDTAAAQQQQDRLLQLYKDLGAKYPNENAVQHAIGDYCAKIGKQDLAVQYWHRAEAIDAKDAASAEALGGAALTRGDVIEARNQFRRAVDANPNVPTYHYDLGNVLFLFRHQLADPPGAAGSEKEMVASLEQFRLAADLAPHDAMLAQAYAETFYGLPTPDWPGALAAWEKVRLLNSPNDDLADSHLARISLRLGRPDDVDRYLAKIHDPQIADMKANLHAKAETLRAHPSPTPAP